MLSLGQQLHLHAKTMSSSLRSGLRVIDASQVMLTKESKTNDSGLFNFFTVSGDFVLVR